jgi:small-conductance mechanosensitive channel
MTPFWETWPWWAVPLVSTAAIVVGAVGIGYIVRRVVSSRLTRLAATTDGHWDDVVIHELRRRIPFWAVLVGVWMALDQWPVSPQTRTFGARLLSALGVASVTIALASMGSKLVRWYGPRTTPAAPVSALTQNLVRIVITTLGVLVIVRSLGYDITPMLTALGVGGLAVALALQQPLSNLFSGLFVTLAGQIQIGDYVRLDTGVEGVVTDFNWHSTLIQAPAGNLVIVPNARVAQAIANNFSRPQKDLGMSVDFGTDYRGDLQAVEALAVEVGRDVMRAVPGGVPDFEPSVRYHSFTDFSVRFSVNLRVREFADQALVRHEFVKRLHARLKRGGMTIPVPARVLPPADDPAPAPS